MKIAYDAKRLFNNNTGLGNYSRTMINILSEYFPDNEYQLYTPLIKNKDFEAAYSGNSRCRIVNRDSKLFGSIWRSYCQASEMKKDGVQIYHGLSNEITNGLSNKGIRSVVTIHDLAFITFPGMYKPIDRWIYNSKFRKACRNCDVILSISKSTENDIVKYYGISPEKIQTIYQPVNPIYYKAMDLEEAASATQKYKLPKDYMLYVGSINSRKNLLGILKAMQTISPGQRIPLVVVGNGRGYKQEVMQYISSQKMEKDVIMLGTQDNRELMSLYRLARLFVYPSFYEGFGLPVVEAMLCGCPVVSSNVSSLPEAAGPASLLADPYSVESIADCIQKGLEDSALRERMIDEGYRYAMENFDPGKQAGKVMELYKKLI
ncbi:MAG: glycosyltransferase family 4 protein [Bacteroidales bacterium]|nr:glycosyltransferase family 4 protein [Bacteroidales bacterium]